MAAPTGGHLSELADLVIVSLVLVEHLPEGLSNGCRSLPLQHQFVHVLGTLFLDYESHGTFRGSDDSLLAATFDVQRLGALSPTHSDGFDPEAVRQRMCLL